VLEALMNEFFATGTSNERKREIEGVLHNFSSQQGAWKHCLNFMSHSTNQYVCMYSLTTIEVRISNSFTNVRYIIHFVKVKILLTGEKLKNYLRFQVLTAASMMFRVVVWVEKATPHEKN
jgi:hypothetical protein